MPRFDTDQVRRYYDDNTGLQLSLGQGSAGTIHRALWGPGVRTRADAMLYVERLLLERLQRQQREAGERLHVVDLGCGVAATLCRLVRDSGTTGTGVTISQRQASMARQRIQAAGLQSRVSVMCADFCELPTALPPAQLAYAIESFVHATDAAAFFRECARWLEPGGLLIICDDFVSQAKHRSSRSAQRWLERFQQGWVISSLLDAAELGAIAETSGFRHEQSLDLSAFLELGRPRDLAIAVLMRCLGWLPVRSSYWSMLYGGHALQVALKHGYLQHLFTVWRRLP